jgi:NAD(P)H-quinone oxidoreductase subunit H
MGIFIMGDDNMYPWRLKIRPADFNNLQAFPKMVQGLKVADLFVTLGSVDVVMGSVDR